MPCIVCNGNIWICSDDENLDCGSVDMPGSAPNVVTFTNCGNKWCYKRCVYLDKGSYKLWFRPASNGGNCDALILKDSEDPNSASPPPKPKWQSVGDPQMFGPGNFEVWCKRGGSGGGGGGGNPPFFVAARAVAFCPTGFSTSEASSG